MKIQFANTWQITTELALKILIFLHPSLIDHLADFCDSSSYYQSAHVCTNKSPRRAQKPLQLLMGNGTSLCSVRYNEPFFLLILFMRASCHDVCIFVMSLQAGTESRARSQKTWRNFKGPVIRFEFPWCINKSMYHLAEKGVKTTMCSERNSNNKFMLFIVAWWRQLYA